jgi:hypothetical protein
MERVKKTKKISISILLFYCVRYRILSPEEAEHAILTLELPPDVLDRLRRADLANKN